MRHAEQGYPDEVCGMLTGLPGVPSSIRVRPITNIAGREPQVNGAGVSRSARTAYLMDPVEQLQALRETEAEGCEVLAFYHSHPDHEAYFAAMDRERAMVAGEPIWPGPSYLVVSVKLGRAVGARWFTWDPARRDFGAENAAPLGVPAQEQA